MPLWPSLVIIKMKICMFKGEGMKKIIIDTDPGMDDSLALILALKSEQFEIEAITTVAGNYPIETTTQNALKVLEMMEKETIPVYQGSSSPMRRRLPVDPFSHGEDGQGENFLPTPKTIKQDEEAYKAIAKIVENNPHEITIITLGPLTNIGLFIENYPQLVPLVKEVICLAGTFGINEYSMKNATGDNPHSEWNVYVDPEAAKMVIESGMNVTCIGLDVSTHSSVNLSETYLDALSNSHLPEARFMKKAIDFTIERGFQSYTVLIDSMAIAYALDSSILRTMEAHVGVETKGELTLGMTLLDQRHHHVWDDLPLVNVAYEANYEKFTKLVMNSVLKEREVHNEY